MYNDLTPELIRAREQAVVLSSRYNVSFGSSAAEREAILGSLLGSVSRSLYFEPTFR
jgi:maltose O-acetyltransferase